MMRGGSLSLLCFIGIIGCLWSNYASLSTIHSSFSPIMELFDLDAAEKSRTLARSAYIIDATTSSSAQSAFIADTTTPSSPPPPRRPNGRTLGFLQDLCKIDDYPGMAPSCFYSPRDLMPNMMKLRLNTMPNIANNTEFAPYLDTSCHEKEDQEEVEGKCSLHWRDLVNDEYNGVSWCPSNHRPVYHFGFPTSPCEWHHRIALMNFAQCMLHKWNFPFFLDTGGLLGSMRNGGFEITDYDVDIGVWIRNNEQRKRLMAMADEAEKLVDHSLELQNRTDVAFKVLKFGSSTTIHFVSKINNIDYEEPWLTHVDTAWFYSTADNSSSVTRPAKPGDIWDIEELFPIRQCNVMGQIFPCPRQPYAHLKNWRNLKNSDLFLPLRNTVYFKGQGQETEFRRSSNRSMSCLEKLGFPTLRSPDPPFKPYYSPTFDSGRIRG